jgi:hypothetical protein
MDSKLSYFNFNQKELAGIMPVLSTRWIEPPCAGICINCLHHRWCSSQPVAPRLRAAGTKVSERRDRAGIR